MSSVVISGDISGSVTLDAPSVAGTTVLTLPATSGTIVTGPGGVTQVASGGTGANTLTANNVILGNGTSAVQFVAPGSSGNVLTSNGTTWTSAAAASAQLQTEIFTAPGTWTKPASCTQVRVTVIGGGGAGGAFAAGPFPGRPGGAGGYAKAIVPVSAPVSITVGIGGTGSNGSGTSSSFGPAVTSTGGGGGQNGGTGPAGDGAAGTGTVATGTALRTKNVGLVNDSFVDGSSSIPGPAAITYSITGDFQAGINGVGGNGPSPTAIPGRGGVSGAVIVEFVG